MHKRRRRAEMAAPTIVMLVFHDTTIQGGGLPWITFLVMPSPLRYMASNLRDIKVDALAITQLHCVLFPVRINGF